MSPSLPAFDSRTRLLVLAPHPDDETLATGALILAARAAGAEVRVVFATDGDDNPWPQRWIEKRWRIGADERAAWGRRRRAEARAALRVLGVDAADACFLGWPDQGLTEILMRDERGEGMLAALVADFAPSHVALPSLADRHPDHGALGVLGELAITRAGVSCTRLDYLVHGEARDHSTIAFHADHQRRKLEALHCHASQVRLSRARLLRIARRAEGFRLRTGSDARAFDFADSPPRIGLRAGFARRLRGHDLLVVLPGAAGSRRLRIRLGREDGVRAVTGGVPTDATARVEWRAGQVCVTLPDGCADASRGYAKLERRGPRLVVFDATGWRDLAELANGAVVRRLAGPALVGSHKPDPVGIDA